MQSARPTTWSSFLVWSQTREAAFLLGLSLFLPFLIHLLPSYDDAAWGPRLLPIFYAPLLAALTPFALPPGG